MSIVTFVTNSMSGIPQADAPGVGEVGGRAHSFKVSSLFKFDEKNVSFFTGLV